MLFFIDFHITLDISMVNTKRCINILMHYYENPLLPLLPIMCLNVKRMAFKKHVFIIRFYFT